MTRIAKKCSNGKMDWGPFEVCAADERPLRSRGLHTREGLGDRLRTAAFAERQAREAFLWAADKFAEAPRELRSSWRQLAAEESKHLGWLLARMVELGLEVAGRPVSDRLWRSLIQCRNWEEFAEFMACAEERGKAAEESFQKALSARDPVTADIFGRIAAEEASHISLQKGCLKVAGIFLALVLAGSAFAGQEDKIMTDAAHQRQAALTLTSPAFKHMERIPKVHTCDGKDLSPALRWGGVPKQAKSLALIMDDPDAPPGTWVHWILYDIPPGLKDLPEGLPKTEVVLGAPKHGLCWGVAQFDRVGYYGPCPPPGSPHRYFFKLYALDSLLGLKARAAKDEVLKAMEGHVLANVELVGIYQR